MRIDHIVVHVDNDPSVLDRLRTSCAAAGFPFDPTKGKGTQGFKVANIWIGDEYLEIPWLKKPDGGGWQKVTMPWRYLYTPELPGTDLQIAFFEYDPGAAARLRPLMKPNSRENGIDGVRNVTISLPKWEEGIRYLKTLFPNLRQEGEFWNAPLSKGEIRFMQSHGATAKVRLDVYSSNPQYLGKAVRLDNVELAVVESLASVNAKPCASAAAT